MRRTATVLTLLVLLTTIGWSQSTPQHPVSGFAYIGSFTAPVNTGEISGAAVKDKADMTGEICVFRNGTGQISYIVNSATIRAEGSGIDALTTTQLFDLLARSAVKNGAALYKTSGTVTVLIDVSSARSGSGSATRLASSSAGSYNTFSYDGGSAIR